uniref:Uncharacterized protein n=1 Tax=Globodera rostochiensis TaxID=31243 RepID=A0A914GWI7_GLORO
MPNLGHFYALQNPAFTQPPPPPPQPSSSLKMVISSPTAAAVAATAAAVSGRPLPPNWEISYTENGEKYFIDHNTGTTTWDDPRDTYPHHQQLEMAAALAEGQQQQQQQPPLLLPDGWERVDDERHGTFYVDHINKRTQYERPTSLIMPTKQPIYDPYQHQATTSTSPNGLPQPLQHQQPQADHHGRFASMSGILSSDNGGIYGTYHNGNYASHQHHHQNGVGSAHTQFTRNPVELRGEILSTRIQKGPKGLGFTLIGNDGTNLHEEFIQIKTIIANGPAAGEGTLRSGDVLVTVNDRCMLGASQDDACQVFRAINVGEFVCIQICRGYSLQMDPTNRIFTENVYASNTTNPQQFNNQQQQQRLRENHVVQLCKGSKGFGFTVYDDAFGQRVKSILHPDQCPNLLEGDTILEVDGRNVRALPHPQLVQMLHDFPLGYRCKIVVQRRAPKQRSRTPTAGFRYGYGGGGGQASASVDSRQTQQQQQQHRPLFVQRSKTPGPSAKSNQQQQQQQRQSMYHQQQPQQQQPQLQQQNWPNGSTTLPRSLQNRNTATGNNGHLQPHNDGGHRAHNFSSSSAVDTVALPPPAPSAPRMRPSSSTLGFCPTPAFVPISALNGGGGGGCAGAQNGTPNGTMNGRKQSIVVNLISQPSGFGFHLLGGAEENKPLSVGAVIAGGAADLDGRLRVNDQIVKIDVHRVEGTQHNHAVELIRQAAIVGHVRLVLLRDCCPSGVGGGGEFSSHHSPATTGSAVGSQGSRGNEFMPYDVTLVKLEGEPDFGCTIISHNHRYIADILPGSAAQRSARLRVGDCVLAVNGHSVANMSHQQVLQYIRSNGNTLTLSIDPALRMMDPSDASGGIQNYAAPPPPQKSSCSDYGSIGGGGGGYGTVVNGGGGGTVVQQQQHQQQQRRNLPPTTNVFFVELRRGERGFGFSIRGGAEFGMPLFILKIADVGPAAGSAMQIGDQLVAIDGESCIGMSHERAIGMIKERQQGEKGKGRAHQLHGGDRFSAHTSVPCTGTEVWALKCASLKREARGGAPATVYYPSLPRCAVGDSLALTRLKRSADKLRCGGCEMRGHQQKKTEGQGGNDFNKYARNCACLCCGCSMHGVWESMNWSTSALAFVQPRSTARSFCFTTRQNASSSLSDYGGRKLFGH